MIEQAFKGRRNYRIWSLALLVVAAGGVYASALQSADGFVHTGMGNNAIWGLYHAQLPFLASIAAASLAILVPGTLQKHSFLASLAPLAAFLGATASAMSLLFIAADLGMQRRILTLLLNPSPGAPASRRSLVRVSVPVWGIPLSGPLPIVALVCRYHTNKLIGRILILYRNLYYNNDATTIDYKGLIQISLGYTLVQGRLYTRYAPVRRSSAEQAPCYPSTCMC